MFEDQIIPVEIFCAFYQVERSFLDNLETHGLISISSRENKQYILLDDLASLEKYSRIYYELNVNVAGIEVLNHLLDKIKILQQEAELLKARLRIYE